MNKLLTVALVGGGAVGGLYLLYRYWTSPTGTPAPVAVNAPVPGPNDMTMMSSSVPAVEPVATFTQAELQRRMTAPIYKKVWANPALFTGAGV